MNRPSAYMAALLVLAASLCMPLAAQQTGGGQAGEKNPLAMEALNKMGAYLRSLKAFQVQAEATTEDVLETGEKVQFAQRSNILARMPDRLLVDMEGDRYSRLFLYDGKSFTLFARRAGYYATTAAPPGIGQLAEVAYDKYGIDIPLVDLFLWGGPRASTPTITSAALVGPSQIGGVSCDHYAFRQPGLDWQVWIQKGDYPLPRKLVLTTLSDEARPQHVSVLTWNLAPSFNEAAFTFDPPPGASKILFAEDKAASAAGKN